jgi:hypothetical protein
VVFKLSEAQKATIKKFWEEWSRSSKKAPRPAPLVSSPETPPPSLEAAEPKSGDGTPRPI